MIRYRTMIAALAAALALSACQTSQESTRGAGAAYQPGTYTGKAMGMNGVVEVSVTVDSSRIKEVAIAAEKETASIGGPAAKALRAQILERQGVSVDVVAGATKTSAAVQQALAEALGAARGERRAKGLADGKYVVKAMGHEGFLYVATVFRGGAIESCKVVSHEETAGIGNYAAARIPARIVKAQSLLVDSVSGASSTSSAIKAAVAQAIKEAGGDVSAFQKAVPAQIAKERVERHVDVVIAGAGAAGLMAGARLAERGLSVLIFEKQDIPGGSMPMTYGGIVSTGSEVGARFGQGKEKADPNWNKDLAMEARRKSIDPAKDRFDKAMPYHKAMFDIAGQMSDWMRDIGIGFEPMGFYEGGRMLGSLHVFSPGMYQGGSGYAAMYLADRVVKLGGSIVYATPVTSLRVEGGRAVGLVAEGRDGKTWVVSADAVLLATGGFSANKEMIAKYYPEYKDYEFNGVAANTGDGIAMGLAAGAAVECMGRELGAFLAAYGSRFEIAYAYLSVPGLFVAGDGVKLASTSHKGLGRAIKDPAYKGAFYYVMDDEGAAAMRDNETAGYSYGSVFDRGEAVHYPSLAAAAKALNLPKLEETVAANNEAARGGKPRISYIETRDGVWMLRCMPNYYLTTGGLAIDTKAKVLDTAGKPIPGLYAAGDVVGSIEEKDGADYAYGFDSAISFAYIAASTMASELKR